MKRIRTVGLTVKSDLSDKDAIVTRVLAVLDREGVRVQLDAKRFRGEECAKGRTKMKGRHPPLDLFLIIGGDGTIFRAIRELGDRTVPVLGINRGAVGFLAEIDVDELDEWLPRLLRGHGILEHRHMLSVTIRRRAKDVFHGSALNEAVIAQGAIARLLNLTTTVRGEALATYRADGLIVATPTGSTAYSLSAGGPVVHPRLSALILTPINPHSFTQKPIVIPGSDVVDVEVVQKPNHFVDSEVSLTLDGQIYFALRPFDHVIVRTGGHSVTFLRRKEDTFFATLRSKLKWGESIAL